MADLSNLSDAELLQLEQQLMDRRAKKKKKKVDKQRLRTMAQGATFGFGEEIEAFVRSLVPGQPEYKQIRNELRTKLKAYKQAHPGEALSLELAGALVPAVLTLGTAAGPTAASTTARLAGRGAIEGAAAGIGYGEAEGLGGQLIEAGTGAATGAAISGSLGRLTDYVRQRFGDKINSVVQQELMDLQGKTGKSVDELIYEIGEGRVMADNQTLMFVLKNYVNEGGKAGTEALRQTKRRAAVTGERAQRALQESLAPDMDENVLKTARATQGRLKEMEGQAYREVFEQEGFLSPEATKQLQDAVQRIPSVVKDLNIRYQQEGIVPLFVKDPNGAIRMARQPTVQDAEIIRRRLSSSAEEQFKRGAGDIGTGTAGIERGLRGAIDEAHPAVGAVRSASAERFRIQEAFDLGRSALGKNVDELELAVEGMSSGQLKMFRAGVMDGIRNKARRLKTTAAQLADEDRQIGQVLRLALPEGSAEDVIKKLEVAGETQQIASKMPQVVGSPTQPLQREAARTGRLGVDAARATQGDPMVVVEAIHNLLKRKQPNMTDAHRQEVVRVLFSEDPELVAKALTDKTAMRELNRKVDSIIGIIAEAGRIGGVQQGSQAVTEEVSGILGGL